MIRKILMGLAAVVGFTTVATAATPVGVWDGFNSLTSGDYTWTKSAGTTVEEGVVMIGSDGGLTIANPTGLGDKAVTFIADIEGFDPDGAQMTIFDIGIGANRVNISNLSTTDKAVYQLWNAANGYGNVGQISTGKVRIITTYSGGSGTTTYVVGGNTADSGKLKSSGTAIDALGIGCYKGTERVAEGMKIYRLAMFNSKLSEAEAKAYQFPSEIKEYYATMDKDETGFGTLDWNPTKPAEGFAATDTLIITNTATSLAVLNIDENLSALKLKIVSEQTGEAGVAITKNDDVTVAIGTYDFSEVEGRSIIAYETSASVIAGADTGLVAAKDPSLTIAEGKKLTVSYETDVAPTLTASKVSNAGTLHFMFGTAESPILLTGNANFGVITLDENTYVKHDDKAGNRKYQVTGSGATSFYEVTRNDGGSAGMAEGSTFENLILVSGADSSNTTWLERATLKNVGLDAKGAFKINGFTPTIRSLTGSGTVGKNGTAALTIACTEAANYAGASDLAFTIAEGTALQTLSGAYTGALTVNEDAQVKLTGAANPSSIAGLGSVTIASDTGVATNTSNTANYTGTITVDASVTTLNLGTSRPTCDFVFSGITEVVYTENVSDDGVVQQLNVTSGAEPTYKVMGVDGTEKVITEGKYTPTVTGKAAWYAWEFSGNLDSVGQNTEAMGKDHGPFYTDDNAAVYAYSQTWKNLTWPDEFTTAIACTLPTNANVCLVGWGQKSGGFALTAGDVSKNEVKLVYWPSDTQYTVLTTMTVPNASTCEHLYLVTKTANSIKVYLDGALTAEYKGALTLGLGIQVGTVFQGVGNTGLIRLDNVYSGTNDCKAVVNSLRIYKTILGPNAMAQLVTEFPYKSPNGTFTRALTGAENQWVAADAWTKVGPGTTHAAPDAESTVNLSAAAEATITLNLEEPTDYEALNLTGDGAITIAAPAANTNKISSSGLVKIGSDATIEYSAMDLSGTTIQIAAGKTLTIDASMIDLTQYYATTAVPLTGLVTGEGEIAFEVPEAITGRSAEAVFNESNNTWELKITVIKADFIYDGGEWTWSGGAVSTEIVSNHTELAVIVRSGTLEWPMDRASFEVQGGTLKAATAPAVPCTVEVTQKAGTFDLNGIAPTSEANNFTVTMAGGKLTNSSEAQGLIKSLTLTGGATVDTSVGVIAIQNYKGGWGATTLTLDAHSLTKTGTNRLEFVATTVVSDGGSIEVDEGTIWTQESSNFGDATIHISTSGAFEVRSGVTATVQTINGDGKGAKIIVHGTISAFTLKDTATIEGEGTFGTITLEDDGTLYIGEKRGLTLEGEGTVNAQLTLVEMAAAEPITLFTTTEGEFDVELTDYNGRDLEPGTDYTIEGGVVTPKAVPFIYNDGWTWNKDSVEASTVQSLTGVDIIVEGGTCEWNIDRDITVNGGTLKATGAKKANAAITVGEKGTFDVNGRENTEWTVVLMGGALVNNGGAIGNTKKQINLLTVVDADSTVDAAANFGLIKAGYNPTTLDLGGKKLTKTGAATFWLCNATVTNGTFEIAKGTLEVTGNADTLVTVFADDASLVLDKGTTLAVTRPLTIGAIEAKGATINNTKSITAFSLKGEATLAGNGTWGAITLDSKIMNPAILNVGNLREFTIEGDGTVNVELTDVEYDDGKVDVFTTTSEDVKIGTVIYNGKDITQDCTISGGSITAISKGIWTVDGKQYPTLAKAYESLDADDGGTIKLMTSTNIEEETSSMFEIHKDYVTIDLGGNELTMAKGFDIYNTYFTLTNGTLVTTVGCGVWLNGNTPTYGGCGTVIASDATIQYTGTDDSKGCFVVQGYMMEVYFNGKAITTQAGSAISGLGKPGDASSELTIGATAVISGYDAAIYFPVKDGALLIEDGATITSTTGTALEAKAGTVTINGGTFTTEAQPSHTSCNDGPSTKGYAVAAVNNAAYGEGLEVAIKGGTFNGTVANVADTTTHATFVGLTGKIEGGQFTIAPDDKLAADNGYFVKPEGGTYFVLVEALSSVTMNKPSKAVPSEETFQFEVTGYEPTNAVITATAWAVEDYPGSGSTGSTITEDGLFTAGTPGWVKVKVTITDKVGNETSKTTDVEVGAKRTKYGYLEPQFNEFGAVTGYETVSNIANTSFTTTGDITLSETASETDGWYYFNQDFWLGTITIDGDVKIILKNGVTVQATSINVPEAATLTIYAQSNGSGMGELKLTGASSTAAGIGGVAKFVNGEITINGGKISAVGKGAAAGIGGGDGAVAKTIRINGGKVTATGGNYGESDAIGIGSGANATSAGTVYVGNLSMVVKAGAAEATTVIEHPTATTNLATIAAFNQKYVTIELGEGPEPVDPSAGGTITCDTEEQAKTYADAITAKPEDYIKAPEGVTGGDVAKYQKMFQATANGKVVTLELTEAATNDLQVQVGEDVEAAAADLTNPTTAKTTLTNVTPGMYYWIKGATDVTATWKDGEAKMADSDKSVELTKPTFEGTPTQSFYKISVDFKAPKKTGGASYPEYWGGGEAQSI